jgi:tellurite resistance protein
MTKLPNLAVPASFFGSILGLVGLGSCWRLAVKLWTWPAAIPDALMLGSAALWLILLLFYLGKWVWLRAEALAEFRHPVLCCFVGLVPVSTALIGFAIQPFAPDAAVVLATVGICGQLVFGVYRTGQLWMGGRDPTTTTPVLYLPTVAGSFVSAAVLSAFGHPQWGAPFFGAGLLSWLAIESVLLNRLYTSPELAAGLRPSLGIQLAPPTVGCATYLSLNGGSPDLIAQAMLGYGIFHFLVLCRLLPWILRQPFAASYWAFTFGVSALALSVMRFAASGTDGPFARAAPWVFLAANLIIGGIAVGTVWLLIRGRLLPPRLVVA